MLLSYRRFVVLFDAAVAGLAVALAVVVRFDASPQDFYLTIPVIVPFAWVALLAMNRAYESRFIGAGTEEFERVLRSGLSLFTVIAVLSFSLDGNVSRSIVLVSIPSTVLGSLVSRKIARRQLHRARARGKGLQRTLVVGRGEAVHHLVQLLRTTPDEGLEPVGVCLPDGTRHRKELDGVPVTGDLEGVLSGVDATRAQVVAVVCDPDLAGHLLRKLSWALEERGVELLVSPGIVEVAGPRLSIRPVAGLSLLHLERPAAHGGSMLLKSAFDRAAAAAALVLLAPFMIAIAIAVRMTSRGPALFTQTRVGVDGCEFSMYKFRSMVCDAEDRLIDLRDRDDGNGVLFKMRCDPRVTPLGAWLRRFSIDELPQLFNVLRGDMSLVGPRPPLPEEVARYEPDAARRLRVRPGITGLWQVSGRSDLTWEQSLRLDLRYVDNWSMALDLSILWKTVQAVFRGSGAY
jgi:exopolysaccharide biosynthesis polyprenyl glycosylphosphotransferase